MNNIKEITINTVETGRVFQTTGTFPRLYVMLGEVHRDGTAARYQVRDYINGVVHNLVAGDREIVKVQTA